jgi:IS30 family transposase
MGGKFKVVDWEAFDALIEGGSSFEGASRAVRISRSTARHRWIRLGRMNMQSGRTGGLPRAKLPRPVELPVEPYEKVSGRLTYFERCVIQVRLHDGCRQARIAAELQRSPSVISREIRRNTDPRGVYDARFADRRATRRRKRPRNYKLIRCPDLAAFVESAMDQGWSPKLISAVLKRTHPDNRSMQVSHETIYQCLYVQARGALRQDLYRQLSLARRSRVPRTRVSTRGKPYREALRISQRPPSIDDRAVCGHWEGDLIIGGDGRSAIGTLVERSTRFVILLHLPGGRHTADVVAEAMITSMGQLPAHLRRSITWDRGIEMADYSRIMLELHAPVYFADPHSPWQRPGSENVNGLLRQYFPKGTDLSIHTKAELQRVANQLNDRPRARLGYAKPIELMTELVLR